VNTAGGPRLQLSRQRDVTALFRDALVIYGSHLWTFLALAAVIVIPVELVVQGIGMEQLTAGYDAKLTVSETVIGGLVTFLVITPLITAICIHALRHLAEGGRPVAREALVAGFEAFTPLFFAVALAAAGIALGLVILVVPGIYVFVRWFFVPQTVVLEGDRGPAALARSSAATQGFWWRTFGLIVLAQVITLVPTLLIGAPFTSIADSTDRAVWNLVGTIVTEMVTAPFVAIFATLLWFDLCARRGGGAV
jgi:hypothetical protein